MSLFRRIFAKGNESKSDPTADWPSQVVCDLMLVPCEGRFCGIKIGSPIGDAAIFGKPSSFRWIQNNYCELIYSKSGFQIDFDTGRLAYIAIFLDCHLAGPDIVNGFDNAVADLRTPDGRSIRISKDTKQETIEGVFGSPDFIDDTDSRERIITYNIKEFTMECEVHPGKTNLMRMNIYPATEG